MGRFDGKVVWMTGAGSGIGRAGALMFAEGGATVALLGRRKDKLEETAAEIAAARRPGRRWPQVDVGDRAEVDRVARRLLAELGRVDILVNNAGLNVLGNARRMENLTPEDWDHVIRVNLTGQYNMFHAVFEPMRAQKEGLIINVISTAAKNPSGVAGMAYQSAKFGMMGFGVSLNKEAWKFGIRTCNIFPDETNTEIMLKRPVRYSEEELARILQPEDLAQAMSFVASLHPRASVHDLTALPDLPQGLQPGRDRPAVLAGAPAVLRIGIDVGGTFTDVVGLRDGRELFIAKVPTTPGRLANGILRGVERLLRLSGLAAADVVRFTHSTTVATNAILEQRGARVALLATEGFSDILEIGRQKRNQMYDLFADGQTPTFLAPRRLRVGIRERIDADGSVLVPLDEVAAGRSGGRRWFDGSGSRQWPSATSSPS